MATKHTIRDFETHQTPTWCPGCGDFGIWTALKGAVVELGLAPHDLVVVFGIGCAGNQANFVRAYGFHGLHGRALPVAEGIALANHGLTTIVVGGDGDGYGEGLAHFIHTMRANPNITYLVHDNQLYGLTKGQASPTSMQGFHTSSTPFGNPDEPLNPLSLAIATDCGFVARGFAGDVPHLQQLIVQGIKHRGFSFIDILQPCVTFNHLNTYSWFYERIVKLDTLQHDPHNRLQAWQQATSGPDQLPIGVFYQADKPTLEDRFEQLHNGPLVEQHSSRDLSDLLTHYT
ncbi:MAG: 2-oxoacid ferredoxin oxidoreductase [Candidatus Kerfeldbacteria bacterium]|nr:2-oxoacid ferredoxin oxidoreductase [Candidatus Kerfeldbacteria bacterium]